MPIGAHVSTAGGLSPSMGRAQEMGAAGRARVLGTFSYEQFRLRIAGMLRDAFPLRAGEIH